MITSIRFGVLLLALAIVLLCLPATAQENHPTAREVIERIKEQVGVPWREQTVDTFKAGDPDTRVTGVATTMMATTFFTTETRRHGEVWE